MILEQKKKKNSEELLSLWTQLKPKLTKLTYLLKKKELIKEVVHFHLLQASSFLPRTVGSARMVGERHQNVPNPEWKTYLERVFGAERTQKLMDQAYLNEKVVKECKELLAKLEEESF